LAIWLFMQLTELKKLNSIQYLRAIAALLVVYSHAIDVQMVFGTSWQQNFLYIQNFGAIGVDIFFVISGFIISHITINQDGPKQSWQFLKKRFIRINPSYYAASIIYILSLFALNQVEASRSAMLDPDFIKSSIKTLTIVPLFDHGNDIWSPWLVVGWTLSFEWLFYVMYTLAIFFSIRNKSLLLVLVLCILTVVGYAHHSKEVHYVFLTNPIVWEFCFGVIIAWLYKKINIPKIIAYCFLIAGTGALIYLVVHGYGGISEAHNTISGKDSWMRVVKWGMPSAAIVAGLLFIEKNYQRTIFKNKVLLLLGDASYAIYLIHTCMLGLVIYLLQKIPAAWQFLYPDVWVFVILGLAVLASIAYFKLIEKPMLKGLNKLFFRSAKNTHSQTNVNT